MLSALLCLDRMSTRQGAPQLARPAQDAAPRRPKRWEGEHTFVF